MSASAPDRGKTPADGQELGDRQPSPPSLSRLLATLGVCTLVAVVILVVAVLPAEYQIDPTGIGGALGLDRLRGGSGAAAALGTAPPGHSVIRDEPFRSETKTLELAPEEEMELKIAMKEGDSLVYSWRTEGGAIYSDFHAEPFGELPGEAIRYQESEAVTGEHGTLNAPFAGHHGWYWVNPHQTPVEVTIEVSGFYAVVKERRR